MKNLLIFTLFLLSTSIAVFGDTFRSLKPCRLLDTRAPEGAGSGVLKAKERRTISAYGACSIPDSATSLFANVTILPAVKVFGYITVFPSDLQNVPNTSLMNSLDGGLKSNSTIIELSKPAKASFIKPDGSIEYIGGQFDIYVTDPTHVLIDVIGYFSPEPVYVFGSGLTYNEMPRPNGGIEIHVSVDPTASKDAGQVLRIVPNGGLEIHGTSAGAEILRFDSNGILRIQDSTGTTGRIALPIEKAKGLEVKTKTPTKKK